MALPTVAALIHQAMVKNHPGKTIAELEKTERKRKSYVQQWCDKNATCKLPPQHETIYALSDLLGVSAGDLYLAFLADSTGIDPETQAQWRSGLSKDHAEIIGLYEATAPDQRHMLMEVLRLFAAGFRPGPSLPPTDGQAPTTDELPTVPRIAREGKAGGSRTARTPHPKAAAL